MAIESEMSILKPACLPVIGQATVVHGLETLGQSPRLGHRFNWLMNNLVTEDAPQSVPNLTSTKKGDVSLVRPSPDLYPTNYHLLYALSKHICKTTKYKVNTNYYTYLMLAYFCQILTIKKVVTNVKT
ncbi:hypothetical protein NQ318_004033 [Aromia moschata]|uniref:Uncharacterized protein n=1 Tax=Aromia moschata TaxID=1265417 RepID=A0AAV8Z8L5_9CUCU|nr:hypothetical protein NQ318_004033 [Aromia moschata]